MKPILAIFLICASLMAFAEAWHQPTALGRVRFKADKRAHSLLIPVPEEFASSTVAIDAVAEDGKRLAASPVVVGGKCIAAAVNTGKSEGLAYVYLLPKAVGEPIPFQGAPVHISRTTRELTTRAHTAPEMLDMFANLHLIPYPQTLKKPNPPTYAHRNLRAFGDFGKNQAWATVPPPQKGHSFVRAFTFSSATFINPTACDATFTANQSQVGWTILLDGMPVANWTKEGPPLPQPIQLSEGLHTVQLLAVQSVSEPIPTPVITCAGKPMTEFLPAVVPKAIGFDFSQKTPKPCQASLSTEGCFSFHQPDKPLRLYKATIADGTTVDFLGEDGAILPRIGDLFALTGTIQPTVRFRSEDKQATFRGLNLWEPPTSYPFSFVVQTPPVHDVAQPLPLAIRLNLPRHLPAILRENLSFRCIQLLGNGAQGAEQTISISRPNDIQSLQLPVTSDTKGYVIECRAATALACQPVMMSLIPPVSADTPIVAQGGQLFLKEGDIPATMLLTRNAQPYKSAAAYTGNPAIYDDGLLTRTAPNAALLSSLCQRISSTVPLGTKQELALLANLHKLVAAKPSKAFIVTSSQTALSQMDALSFICAACLEHGIRPVLVTLPGIQGNPLFANAETAALKLKSLALTLHVDCLDLYTRALLDNIKTDGWDVSEGIRLTTLNDSARRWIFSHIESVHD